MVREDAAMTTKSDVLFVGGPYHGQIRGVTEWVHHVGLERVPHSSDPMLDEFRQMTYAPCRLWRRYSGTAYLRWVYIDTRLWPGVGDPPMDRVQDAVLVAWFREGVSEGDPAADLHPR